MHEVSILQYGLRAVENAARIRGMKRITQIEFTIGALQKVYPDAMQRLFQIITADNPMFSGCKLVIDEQKPLILCQTCQTESTLEGYAVTCPACGSEKTTLKRGDELLIRSFSGY